MAIRIYWWHENRVSGDENYGDLLSEFLVEKISKKKVISIKHPSKGLHKYFFKHYLVIGSIISSATKNSIVWGSGIIKKNDNIRGSEFIAVRGPKTRQRILDLGFNCTEIYGDPAILLPDFYKRDNIKKKYKIGVIPHYVDYEAVNKVLKRDNRIKVINFLTKSIEKTTEDIFECESIVSSSLHGVIVSQAYRIPSLWIKFSNKLSGDNIKFYDYFESMNIAYIKELFIDSKDLSFQLLEQKIKENKEVLLQDNAILEYRKRELLKHCPFI